MSKAPSLVKGTGWAVTDVVSVTVALFPHTVPKIHQIHRLLRP